MSLPKILIIGGGGFIGQVMTTKLAKLGYPVLIPTRKLGSLRDLWVLPQVTIIEADVHDQEVLHQLCAKLSDTDVVINLVGILHDKPAKPYGKSFAKNHVELPEKIITAMNKAGIKRYIHMSALGADSNGPSMYQRSKGDGEKIVMSSGLDWTIFRPSVVFGENDSFINLFASLQKFAPVMPLAGAGVKFQPVYVSDVASAFIKAISMPQTIKKSFNLAGPKIYSLGDLVRFAGHKVGCSRLVIPIPASFGYLQAWMLEIMPGKTLMSRDNLASMKVDNILPNYEENALEKVFGISPQPLEILLK